MEPKIPTPSIWDDVGQLVVYFIASVLVLAVLYAMKLLIFTNPRDDETKKDE